METLGLLWELPAFFVTVTFMLMAPHKSAAQNPNAGPDVHIVSPLPLPVTGTLSVAPGSSFSVNNPESSPVLVRDVDNPTRQPVQASASCSTGVTPVCPATMYTVPVGKSLIIEYASMRASVPVGDVAELNIITVAGGKGVSHDFPLTAPSVAFLAGTAANMGQQVRIYADPGTAVVMEGRRSGTGNAANLNFSISGHLVDVP